MVITGRPVIGSTVKVLFVTYEIVVILLYSMFMDFIAVECVCCDLAHKGEVTVDRQE